MVAIIKTGTSIRSTFYYNENKLKERVAECIMAGNYPDDATNLSEQERLNLLLKLASLNTNVVRNSVHISLNFDPSEQHSKALLKEISQTYMEKIGFGDQPFLVYQHHDAGHPHIHIVSVKVAHDGSRIETQNIGRNQSESARKEIEQEFHLVKASSKKQQQSEHLKPAMVSANYGKVETKRAISNILEGVIDKYKFTSIPELNAVLNRYNVTADRGNEESRTFKNGGLHYRLLNAKGERVGVPINASDFHQKPTLNYLQNRFEINDQLRQKDKLRIKNAIDFTLYGKTNVTLDRLTNILERDGIDTVLRKNDTGLVYGITYVDHRSKAVFNGSSLGKNYSAKAIQERCVAIDAAMANRILNTHRQEHSTTGHEQQVTSQSSLLLTPQQSNDARLANGERIRYLILSNKMVLHQWTYVEANVKRKKGSLNHCKKLPIMASNTRENDISLRKVTDMTRLISILVLAIHFYYFCYQAFQNWHLTSLISDRILDKIFAAGRFSSFIKTKIVALVFLFISLVGVKGKKGEDIRLKPSLISVLIGLFIYFISVLILKTLVEEQLKSALYMVFTAVGFLLILSGGSQFSRLITARLSNHIFNKDNESFPQFEQLLENEYSINLPAEYRYKGKTRQSWINIINPFRGVLVSGSPGSGKTFFVFPHVITQHIEKGFSMFVYDFKYNDLTLLAYNSWLKNRSNFPVEPAFYTINFDDLSRSHRCNPLNPESMFDITDAVESARTILKGLNREWINRQGDFFVESSINFMTAVI